MAPRGFFSASISRTIYAIVGESAYDRVVAITREAWEGWRNGQYRAYTAVAPNIEKLVDIGYHESGGFNLETAIAAKPDVAIIASWQYRGIGEEGVAKLEAAGIPVVVADYNAQTLEKHLISTRIIGQVMNTESRAKTLASEYRAAIEDVQRRVAALEGPRPKVYVEVGSRGAGEIGNSYGSIMWGGAIKLAGGRNIGEGQVERWAPLNPEYVLAQNPELIFLAGSEWVSRKSALLMGFDVPLETTTSRMRPYLSRTGWAGLNAVKNREVHGVYHGGARTLYDYVFLQYIGKAIHPEAFADVDPQANHRRFYETYLPIKADGTFMMKLD